VAAVKVRGTLKGRKTKLSPVQERRMVALYRAGDLTVAELVELFGVGAGDGLPGARAARPPPIRP
jgi:hypothetical protein